MRLTRFRIHWSHLGTAGHVRWRTVESPCTRCQWLNSRGPFAENEKVHWIKQWITENRIALGFIWVPNMLRLIVIWDNWREARGLFHKDDFQETHHAEARHTGDRPLLPTSNLIGLMLPSIKEINGNGKNVPHRLETSTFCPLGRRPKIPATEPGPRQSALNLRPWSP